MRTWHACRAADSSARFKMAGGRARYNAWRQDLAASRRAMVAKRLASEGGFFRRGMIIQIAAEVGCSVATISRDVRRLIGAARRY